MNQFFSVAPNGANYIEYHLKKGVLRNVENSFNALWAPRTALADISENEYSFNCALYQKKQ